MREGEGQVADVVFWKCGLIACVEAGSFAFEGAALSGGCV